jgi:hypothetical protein
LAAPSTGADPSLASAVRPGDRVDEIMEKLRLLREKDPVYADALENFLHVYIDRWERRLAAKAVL